MYKGAPRANPGVDGMQGSYLGPSYSQQEIEQRLTALGARFETLGDEDLIDQCARSIAEGKALRCLSKSAASGEGEDLSELEIAERAAQAENKEVPCKDAKRALAIAAALTSDDKSAALGKLCPL